MPSSKGITAVVAIVLLLMMTVGAAGMAYIFTTGLQTKTQESATGGIESLTESTSSCISVDSVYGNKVYLKNCGSGVITGDSLLVYMDGKPINATMSPAVISKGEVGTLNLSGIWGLSYDTHTLKIGNGVAQVMQRVVAEPMKDNLVGYWRFDEGSGITAYDGSGNGNSGTCYGMGTSCNWTGGKFGGALGFDGVDDYVRSPDSGRLPLGNSPRTIMAWINPSSYPDPTYNGIVAYGVPACGQGSMLSIKNDGRLSMAFWCNDAYQTAGPAVPLNNWTQVAFTYDGGTGVSFFINGQFVQAASVPSPANTQNGALRIGSTDDPGRYFNGTIDEVRIYNRALTPDELVNLKMA